MSQVYVYITSCMYKTVQLTKKKKKTNKNDEWEYLHCDYIISEDNKNLDMIW